MAADISLPWRLKSTSSLVTGQAGINFDSILYWKHGWSFTNGIYTTPTHPPISCQSLLTPFPYKNNSRLEKKKIIKTYFRPFALHFPISYFNPIIPETERKGRGRGHLWSHEYIGYVKSGNTSSR